MGEGCWRGIIFMVVISEKKGAHSMMTMGLNIECRLTNNEWWSWISALIRPSPLLLKSVFGVRYSKFNLLLIFMLLQKVVIGRRHDWEIPKFILSCRGKRSDETSPEQKQWFVLLQNQNLDFLVKYWFEEAGRPVKIPKNFGRQSSVNGQCLALLSLALAVCMR